MGKEGEQEEWERNGREERKDDKGEDDNTFDDIYNWGNTNDNSNYHSEKILKVIRFRMK